MALAAPAAVAVVLLEVVAGRAFYVSPDSIHYVGTARNLVDGAGFNVPPGSAPLEHFPPLFTLVLAAVAHFGPDPLTVARWLNPLFLGASVFLVALLVRRATGSTPAGVAAGVLTGFSFDILAHHSSALTEPMFILATVLALAALGAFMERRSGALLAAAGATSSAALLTRYAGVALVVAGVAALVWCGRDRRWRGALDAAVYGALATAPTLTWLLWARLDRGRATERGLGFRDMTIEYFSEGARTVSQWLVPASLSPGWRMAAAVVVATGLVVLAARVARRLPPPERCTAVERAFAVFAAAYVALLVFDRAFVDRTGMLDLRLLAPLHVAAIVLAAPLAHRAATTEPRPRARAGVAACAVVIVALQVAQGASWMVDNLRDGGAARGGFTAPAWRRSEVVRRAAAVSAHRQVFSNAADAIFLLTGARTEPLPPRSDYLSGQPNRRFAEQLAKVRQALREGGAVVWFHEFEGRDSFLPPEHELRAVLGLRPHATDEVGTLYAAGG